MSSDTYTPITCFASQDPQTPKAIPKHILPSAGSKKRQSSESETPA